MGIPFSKTFRTRAAAVVISGWPYAFPGIGTTDLGVNAEDAVFGRLACPPLSRINLAKKKSEPLLLRTVDQPKANEWHFTLKSGLYWWSGSPVSSEDLGAFLQKRICSAAREKLGVSAACEKYSVDSGVVGRDAAPVATVRWEKKPEFGPFVLNDVAFERVGKDGRQECAGLYRYKYAADGPVNLIPTPGYKQKRPELKIAEHGRVLESAKLDWKFSYAGDSGREPTCRNVSKFPGVIGILWNDRSASLTGSSPEVRKALTQLIPRGELLRAGANGMGDLVSSFLPIQHPGYDSAAKIRPYSVDEASKIFERNGWNRVQAEGPRVDKKTQQPVVVNLAFRGPLSHGAELLQKVIADSFALVGIQTNFVPAKLAAKDADSSIHGTVSLFAADWPAFNLLNPSKNLLSELFSRSRMFEDAEHRRLVKEYALSLTRAAPDFDRLKQLHRKWFAAEVFSPVFQVGVCAVHRGRSVGKINFNDPDWFRSLVL